MVMILSIRSNVNQVMRDLDRLERKQIPFAQATAVNSLAGLVQNGEKQEMKTTFDGVTPFTLGGVKVKRARKSDPTATIFLANIAEQYIAPYISGGRHFLGSKRGILNPKGVTVNRYGNLAKGKLGSLKSRPDVFIGKIKTKSGKIIHGVFQRGDFRRMTMGRKRASGRVVVPKREIRARIKILIRFGDSLPVRHELDWFAIAQDILARNASNEMDVAMKQALASARP